MAPDLLYAGFIVFGSAVIGALSLGSLILTSHKPKEWKLS